MQPFLLTAKSVGVGVGIVVYAVLMHRENSSGQPGLLGAFLAVLPLFLGMFALLANPRTRLAGASILLLVSVLFWMNWPVLAQHSSRLFWLQDMALLLGLLSLFGRTLWAGRKPLCVFFAEMMHGELSPEHARYARRVTVAWTLFFAVLALLSTLLYLLTPLTIWSFYANFLVLPLIGVMFIVEYQVRKRVLADMPHGRFIDAIHAYLHTSRPRG